MKFALSFLMTLSFASFSFAKEQNEQIDPAHALCLESAANAAIAQLVDGDYHVIRDAQDGRVAAIVNLDTEEKFHLTYVAKPNAQEEFFSFENYDRLLNLTVAIRGDGTCELKKIEFLP